MARYARPVDSQVLSLRRCFTTVIGANPVADHADDLWKTFANWADICSDGTVDVHAAKFRLYVTPTKSGGMVKLLSTAITNDEAAQALAKIKALFDAANPATSCNPHISRFLKAGDQLFAKIISQFELQGVRRGTKPISAPILSTLLRNSTRNRTSFLA